ncbi:MAG: NADH-quinone oxidoreductase subunit H [Planctomycetota bacterium]|nr:NADH-quinone oxidoreductase subunit H [Planctomycetota bacterium]
MSLILAAESLAEIIRDTLTECESCSVAIAAIIHVALVGAFFGLPAGIFIWAERKVSARIQDRLGPTRVGGRFGWLQSLADGAKLVQKEDLAPAAADKFLFRIAPYIVVIASFAAFMFLPFTDGWSAVSLDVGLFLLFGMLSLEVLGVILAGYASASKWALFGGMREAAQMVSYEIPMSICALVPIVMAGTLNLNEVIHYQSADWIGVIPPFLHWNVFHPVAGPAFVVYFVCATASCKRAPFDLAEAESELVAGFLTEYSGMRWSFFFLAEYASMFLVSAVAAILFLGGWDDGFGIVRSLKGSSTDVLAPSVILGNLIGAAVLMAKASKLVLLQIWVRWTLPRLRIDQVMTTCLKYLLPMACALFLAAVVYPIALLVWTGRPQLLPRLNNEQVKAEVLTSSEVEVKVAAADGEVIQ